MVANLRWGFLGAWLLNMAVGLAAETYPEGWSPGGERAVVDAPLLAAWNFNEPSGAVCRDVSHHGCDASPLQPVPAGFRRIPGVFGGAVSFSRTHLLRVPDRPAFGSLPQLTFSVWARPTDLSSYREIFRKEDGNDRVLFSFQDNGTILALGLNVNGYVECDAKLDPAQVLDGAWHHCAATFDGRFMRVYLDGREIGALERPGTITAGGPAPGCLGSSGGGECFQGALDELQIYAKAIPPEQITLLYRRGLESIDRSSKEIHELVDQVYVPGRSFAESMAGSRKNLVDRKLQTNWALIGAIVNRVRVAFPQDYENFIAWTGADLLEYFTEPGNDFHVRAAERLVGLLVEYQPLTEHQRKKQTPEDQRRWEEVRAIGQRFDALQAQGLAAQFSPEWITVILDAGRRLDFRPTVFEAVAPYIKPETPPTRDLTAAEARETLQRDWRYQADGKPTPERIRQEITWTRQLAERIATRHLGQVSFAEELAELDTLEKQAAAVAALDEGLYFRVRDVKRAIAFKNPVVDFDKVLLVDMPFPQGSEWRHETRHRLGYMAVPGARLLGLEGLSPAGHLRQLAPKPRCTARSGVPTCRTTPKKCCSVSNHTTRRRSISMR